LHYWGLDNVLIDKYHYKENEANYLVNFLLPLLRTNPDLRSSAR